MTSSADQTLNQFDSPILRRASVAWVEPPVSIYAADKKVLWYKEAVFYEVYVRAFCDGNGDGIGDIIGLTSKLDYLHQLGVDCIWLLPIYPSPLKDDGYDISDYKNIHPDFGTLDDFRAFVDAVHERAMRVIVDLVPNHTSDQHWWFKKSRSEPDSKYRNYYVWSDTNDGYRDVRIIFCDTEQSNWSWDPVAKKYYWHRFYRSQPDLNFDNPDVQEEILDVLKFWLDIGVDGFRVDAIPYLFEREGTSCENLPETHDFLAKMRQFVDTNYPNPPRLLLSEANMWPQDCVQYFGKANKPEFHMAFHFPLMPRLYMALRKHDKTPIIEILKQTPEIAQSCQWCTFLRNHDELTLEMVTPEDRQYMWEEYAPNPRMRLNLGIRRRLAPLMDNDRRKIELLYALLLSLPGSPIIYYGDEIGMGDNIFLPDRNGVRTPMQWTHDPKTAGFSFNSNANLYAPVIQSKDGTNFGPDHVNVIESTQNHFSLFNVLKHMIAMRKKSTAFGWGSIRWIENFIATPDARSEEVRPATKKESILIFERVHEQHRVLCVNNLTDQPQTIKILVVNAPLGPPVDLLTARRFPTVETSARSSVVEVAVEAFGFLWLDLTREDRYEK